jgi:hypothetical protein
MRNRANQVARRGDAHSLMYYLGVSHFCGKTFPPPIPQATLSRSLSVKACLHVVVSVPYRLQFPQLGLSLTDAAVAGGKELPKFLP